MVPARSAVPVEVICSAAERKSCGLQPQIVATISGV
jgi:hypothetical protein